jgi:hypothetical protein
MVKDLDAHQYLRKHSDWFDKSPSGEKLYFESEVIRMMNDFANEVIQNQLVCDNCESPDFINVYCNTCSPAPTN